MSDEPQARAEPKSGNILWRLCRYFTSPQNQTCEAGVAYESVEDSNRMTPCFRDSRSEAICEMASYRTEEEATAEENESNSKIIYSQHYAKAITDKYFTDSKGNINTQLSRRKVLGIFASIKRCELSYAFISNFDDYDNMNKEQIGRFIEFIIDVIATDEVEEYIERTKGE
jgi:hypothetical protein